METHHHTNYKSIGMIDPINFQKNKSILQSDSVSAAYNL